MSPSSARLAAIALTLGAALRLLRLPLRWTEVAWQYAAYPAPTLAALRGGDYIGAMTGFTGLHPPLFSLMHAAEEAIWPAPGLWLMGSVLASLGAVAMMSRRHPLAALLLATAPIQVHYAAEVNNYPLVALASAAVWLERERVADGAPPWRMALVCALAVWTHGLSGFVAALAALSLGRRGWAVLGAMAMAVLPLLPGVLNLALEPMTYTQPAYKFELVARDFVARFGLIGALILPFAAMGARKHPALALGVVGTAAFVLALQLAGVAAPHQFPYLLAIGPPLALLAEASGSRALVALALAQGLWVGAFDLARLHTLRDPAPRAIDLALREAQPGDGVYLLRPAPLNDDDKRLISPVLRRLSPWQAAPMAQPYPFAYDDFRHGQPRLYEGRTVYVNDALRPELAQAIAAHPRLYLVVYDHQGDPRFTRELAAQLGQTPEKIGEDLLFRLP